MQLWTDDTAQMIYSALGENLNGLTDFNSHYGCVVLDVGCMHNEEDGGILKLSDGRQVGNLS